MNQNERLKAVLLAIAKDDSQKAGALGLLDALSAAAGILVTGPTGLIVKGFLSLAKTVSSALKNPTEIDKIDLNTLFVESVDAKLKKNGIDDDKINSILNA